MTDLDILQAISNVRKPAWRYKTEAERLETWIAEVPSEDDDMLLSLARAWMVEGNFLRAVHVVDAIVARQPDLAEPHAIRALALRHINPAESQRSTERAVALGHGIVSEEPSLPPATDETITIWVDLTDLIDYLTVNVTLSGIQRVVSNLMRVCGSHDSYRRTVRPVIPDFALRNILAVDIGLVIELIDAAELYHVGRAHLDRLLARIRASLTLVQPRAGDTFLMPGAFWISHNYDLLKDLRTINVSVSIFIHDLIQVNNPGFVQPDATDVFRRSLIDVLELASFITTNSEFVAKEVCRFMRDDLNLNYPVRAIPLATEMIVTALDSLDGLMLSEEYGQRGYVLCVCTIEVRKNHHYLTDIWEHLIASGRTDIPTLVLVGKWGWEIDSFRRHLADTNNLNGMVRVMSGVSDKLLASLYKHCLFTLYPSFAEGWGLPVGESLVFGKPCLASGVTSIPEVGGPLVRYFDPLDLESGVRAVLEVLDDRDDLAGWTERVQTEFHPRTWTEFSTNLIETTRSLAESARDDESKVFARLLPGEMAVLGGDAVTEAAGQRRTMRTARMARGEGWHHTEFDGAWMKAARGTLRFVAGGCKPGDLVHATVELAGTNAPLACALRTTEGLSRYIPVTSVESYHLAHSARVGQDGEIELTILVRGNAVRFADRDNYVRLIRFGFRRHDNNQDRTRLIEATLFA